MILNDFLLNQAIRIHMEQVDTVRRIIEKHSNLFQYVSSSKGNELKMDLITLISNKITFSFFFSAGKLSIRQEISSF